MLWMRWTIRPGISFWWYLKCRYDGLCLVVGRMDGARSTQSFVSWPLCCLVQLVVGFDKVRSNNQRGVALFEVAAVQIFGVPDVVRVSCVLCLVIVRQLVDDCFDECWRMVRLRCEVEVKVH